MKLTLQDKNKLDLLIALFQLLKNCSTVLKFECHKDYIVIQGMDKSHVCLFFTKINSNWFTSYINEESIDIIIDSFSIFMVLSKIQESQILSIEYNKNEDMLDVDVLFQEQNDKKNKKGEYNCYYKLPIIDLEQDNYQIPHVEYDAEFSINSKQFHDLISQLGIFGDVLNIVCNENEINLESSGENGKMKVAIVIDDLNEFSISEGENIDLSFSLQYILKMCITTKLSKNVDIGVSNEFPLQIKYDLGEDSSCLFYIAPKI